MANINNGVLDGVRRIGAKVREVTIDGQIAGAPLGLRLRGATASGAPATGTWKAGDHVEDRNGVIWICTAAGSPGTWVQTGTVTGVTAADTSVVVGGTAAAPTVRTGTLDVIAADHPPAADWSNNSHKITSVANGGAAQDVAAWGQTVSGILTTLGDIIYENSTPAPARLAGSTSATKQFLTQTGTGSVSAAPAWGTIASGDMPTGTTSAKGALQLDGTASDIQPVGAVAGAGNSGLAADAKHVHVGLLPSNNLSDLGSTATALNNLGLASIPWMPSDDSLLGANFDPAGGVTTQSTAATSRLYLMRVSVRIAQNFNYVWLLLQAAGSGTSTGSFVCVYSSSGTQLAISADIGTSVQTTGPVKLALTSAAAATTPFVWVGMVFLGMTPPTIYRGAVNSPLVNLNTAAASLRFATNGTTAASPITVASNTASNAVPWWCGVS